MGNRERVIADCRLMLETLCDHSKLDTQIQKANEEIALVSGLVSACVNENAEKAIDQDAFNKQYNGLVDRHQKAIARLEKLKTERAEKENRERELQGFIDTLLTCSLVLDVWDEELWRLLVVKGTVGKDGEVVFEFRCRAVC